MKNLNGLLLLGMGIVLTIASYQHKTWLGEEPERSGTTLEMTVPAGTVEGEGALIQTADPSDSTLKTIENGIKKGSVCQCNIWLILLTAGICLIISSLWKLYKQVASANKKEQG